MKKLLAVRRPACRWVPRPSAQCAPDYTGVTLTVSTQNGPAIASALAAAAESWEAKTCGTVNVVEFPFGELYPKFLTAMSQQTGDFDVIGFVPAWLPDFAPFLSTMPAELQQGSDWEDIHPVYRERLMTWDGETKSATMDGDMHMLNLRADLLEDEANKTAFKEKYGYDLAAPVTWAQYLDQAEFFNRPDQGLYGTAEAYKRGGQQFWYFFSHAASYTNNPSNPGSMFFDPETMDAQINNPGWLRALEEYKKALDFNPPGALNNGSGDVRPLYAGGTVAMNIDWADSGVLGATEGVDQGQCPHRDAARLDRDLEPQDRRLGHLPRSRAFTLPSLRRLAAGGSRRQQEPRGRLVLRAGGHQPRGVRQGHRDGEQRREPLPLQPLREHRELAVGLHRGRGGQLSGRAARLARRAERGTRPAPAGLLQLHRGAGNRAQQGAGAVRWSRRPRSTPSRRSGTG